MAYDPRSGTVLLFGGNTTSFDPGDDLWSWNGTSWRLLTPTDPEGDGNPQARLSAGLAWDAARRELLLFGGSTEDPLFGTPRTLDDLWAFDLGSRSWAELTPPERPAGRFFASSFVGRGGRFHVFGGATSAGDTSETWQFDLTARRWSRLEIPGPPARSAMLAAYLDDRDSFIVFGGMAGGALLADVWELYRVDPTEPRNPARD